MHSIDFETGSVANLRQRVAEVEEINEDLVAFARGHAGAVTSIHSAVLAMLPVESPRELARVVTVQWPRILRVDEIAFAWGTDIAAYCGDRGGVRAVEPRLIGRMADLAAPVTMRNVGRGHPLFGAACESIRSEALIRLEGARGSGLLVLGQGEEAAVEARQGAKLLRFLGASVSLMLERWPPR